MENMIMISHLSGQSMYALFNDYGTSVTFKSYPVGHGVSDQNLQRFNCILAQDLPTNLN